jgi:hypothetical protein
MRTTEEVGDMESSAPPTTQDGASVGAVAPAEQLLGSAKHGKELLLPGHRERSAPGSSGWTTRFSSFREDRHWCSPISKRQTW